MDAKSIAEVCCEINSKEREELVKMCMENAFEQMSSVEPNDKIVPKDLSLFTFVPDRNQFVDYATEIIRSTVPIEKIRVELMVPIIKTLRKSSKAKRMAIDMSTQTTPKRRIVTPPEHPKRNLPPALNPTSSGSMTSVSREYFPDSEFVYPGIYETSSGEFVLFCVDNGRYANSWTHDGDVTRFTWVTATKDTNRVTLESISSSTDVYVFRKIQGEVNFRYMGKVIDVGKKDKIAGSIDLSVC
jgi:hypothetical protein